MQNLPKRNLIQCVDELMLYRGLVGSKGLPNDLLFLIKNLHAKEAYRELIYQMRIFFRINCNIGVGFSPSKKNPNYAIQDTIMRNIGNSFDPFFFFQAANIEHKRRKEPAKISFPDPTPAFNSRAFETMRAYMIVERWILMMPLETIVSLVAHELAHVLLYSTQSRYCKSEKATDILAMILVGPDIAKKGMRIGNFKLGYLNDEQLEIAYDEIKGKEKISSFSKIRGFVKNVFTKF
ncbi:MAG TPA: hypothetical protein PLB52_04415 [Candidatus Moranbacteria bacterium]|nr:hypothetical protein [Candidatus Moranbacteria bacterium]